MREETLTISDCGTDNTYLLKIRLRHDSSSGGRRNDLQKQRSKENHCSFSHVENNWIYIQHVTFTIQRSLVQFSQFHEFFRNPAIPN